MSDHRGAFAARHRAAIALAYLGALAESTDAPVAVAARKAVALIAVGKRRAGSPEGLRTDLDQAGRWRRR